MDAPGTTTTDSSSSPVSLPSAASEIDAGKAVAIAQQQLPALVPKFASLQPFVEEVERSQDGDVWEITFRAENPDPEGKQPFAGTILLPFVDKVVRIAARTGTLIGITNPSYR